MAERRNKNPRSPNHGGARQGAGAKPKLGTPMTTYNLRLPHDIAHALRTHEWTDRARELLIRHVRKWTRDT